MMYLKFDSLEQAISILENAGFTVSEYQDHFSGKRGWGTILQIPTAFVQDGESQVPSEFETCANFYSEPIAEFSAFEIEAPETPYNVIAQ
jgi:hypothetical protein